MARTLSLAALIALSGAVAACSPQGEDVASVSNRSLNSVNQPVVERTDYVLDLLSQNGLPASEKARLSDWFGTLGVGYGDHIYVDEPYEPTSSREDVARIAAAYGLLLDEGAPLTTGAVQPGSVRVIVSRTVATVPTCPNWEAKGPNGPSATSSNYGCATNSNLAAMIANPADLVLGQTGTVTDTATGAKAIKIYRDTAPTGTKGLDNVSTTGGN